MRPRPFDWPTQLAHLHRVGAALNLLGHLARLALEVVAQVQPHHVREHVQGDAPGGVRRARDKQVLHLCVYACASTTMLSLPVRLFLQVHMCGHYLRRTAWSELPPIEF